MVFRVGRVCLVAAVAALSVGCGEDASAPAEAPNGDETQFTVDGRGSSSETSGVLQVVENISAVEFSLKGVDASNNLILFYVTFDGVESVAGPHTFPIGLPGAAAVNGFGFIDDQGYYSLRGELQIEMSPDGRASGRFDMGLAFDSGSGPPPGATSDSIPEAMELRGSFTSEWTVDCRTRIAGFTGGHYTHNSPYCQSLTF